MKNSTLRIERLSDCGDHHYFVAVYKNDECLGMVMTDGTLTAEECYKSLRNNWEINEMERRHYEELNRLEL